MSKQPRGLWFAVFLISATLAAFFAAELTAALGAAALGALTAAASTFVAVMGLTMTAFHFLTRDP